VRNVSLQNIMKMRKYGYDVAGGNTTIIACCVTHLYVQ
jgi:hypothetical protein